MIGRELLGWICVATPIVASVYAYVLYPALLSAYARVTRRYRKQAQSTMEDWPSVSISLPVYNEAGQLREVIESLLALDYPREKKQILVISDASTDATDAIAGEYASAGVELLRLPMRRGKTAAEQTGARLLRGEIVVNTDASIRIHPASLKKIIAPFADPAVGLASGRDVSIGSRLNTNGVESGYVDYEMTIRSLETRTGGIIGASGCFYAIRAQLHRDPLPEALSRDFASALIAHEHGYAAVSVDDAICYVPRTGSPTREYRRKVRTIMRGMETLAYKRHLLNPLRHGLFAWKLFSHKICRWGVPWLAPVGLLGLFLLAHSRPLAAVAFGIALAGLAMGSAGWLLADHIRVPRSIAMAGYLLLGNTAVLKATIGALRGSESPVWEPTRREPVRSH